MEMMDLKNVIFPRQNAVGVERRVLIWAPTGNGLLGDSLNCGIPHTCSKAECPICRVFGGLITSQNRDRGRIRKNVLQQPLSDVLRIAVA